MEDQFGGRTDDDLFFDDVEPVSGEAQLVEDSSAAEPATDPAPSTLTPVEDGQRPSDTSPEAPSKPVPPSLVNSRHNPNRPTARQQQRTNSSAAVTSKDKSSNTASANSDARLGSGANPRTKLTEEELTAKMAKMRILNAEKARKFEQAEKDEREHAQAYARGMEEARRRRQADEERRRRGEEDRRRMEEERAKNRERKLKAMGMKEGGWDEGKEAVPEEERRTFRGANGGVRGVRSGGLSGSRFSSTGEAEGDSLASEGRFRGRGRGRGGPRGRGGRSGHSDERNGQGLPAANSLSTPKATPSLGTEDFPALPASETKVSKDVEPIPRVEIPTKVAVKATAMVEASPLSPPVGKWDDEMEAVDAKLGKRS